MKLTEELEFSLTKINKLNKGLKNSKANCFMNVCLQSLLSCPPFFNMLCKFGENIELLKGIGEESLLKKFIHLSHYFNPDR